MTKRLTGPFLSLSLLLALTAAPARSQTVSVWLTTDNQRTKLQQQPSVTFSAAGGAADNPLVVDETQAYQQVEGFGASFTDSAAYLLNRVASPAGRTQAMNDLFTRAGAGIGVSFVRNPMGASDLARSQARQLNPQLTVMATPWSPPGWMKDSGSLVGAVTVPVTGGWQKWTTVSGAVSGASGQHDLYLVYRGTTDIGNVNWFKFR